MARTCASGASGNKGCDGFDGRCAIGMGLYHALGVLCAGDDVVGHSACSDGTRTMDQVRIVLFWSFLHPSHLCSCTDWCVGLSGQVRPKYRRLYLVCDHCVVCDIRFKAISKLGKSHD